MAIVALAPRVGRALAMLAVAACMSGCAGARKFSAAYLPPELEAPPAYNVGNLDLSKFSGPAASSARIELGDVLEISIAASLDTAGVTKFLARVGDDGTTVLPEIGPCQLAGMETTWAEQHISTLCMERGLYRQPNVTVTVKEQRRNRITVVGAVEEPGIVELPRRSSYLMDAIVAAGGLSDKAGALVDITLPPDATRLAVQPPSAGVQPVSAQADQSPTRICFNLAEAAMQPGSASYLPDGAVVRVEKLEPEPVQVVGLVRSPKEVEYPIRRELRLFGALAEAGGPSSFVADKVIVIRKVCDGSDPVVITVSLNAAKRDPKQNIRLAPGDVVSVEQTPATLVMETLNVLRFGIGANVPIF